MRKLLVLLVLAGVLMWPHQTHAAPVQVYWYGCFKVMIPGGHFANGSDHLCHEYPILKPHTHVVGYWKQCRQTTIHAVVYCVRYPEFYVAPPALTGFPPLVARWSQYIYEASHATGLNPRVIAAVIYVESSGIPTVSSLGGLDVGLTQYGPAEAAIVGGVWTYDPRLNILTGSKYLEYLRERYADGNLYLAVEMYNGGPGNPQASYAARVYAWV